MTDYMLSGAIREAGSLIAKAIERHGDKLVEAAKIEANATARAAGYLSIHKDVAP
jgi:hypothetical protein